MNDRSENSHQSVSSVKATRHVGFQGKFTFLADTARRPYSTHARSLTLSVVSPRTEDETGRMSPHHFADAAAPAFGIKRVTTAHGHTLPISHTFSIFDRPIRAETAKNDTSFFVYVVDWVSGSTMLSGVEKFLVVKVYVWLRTGVSIKPCRTLHELKMHKYFGLVQKYCKTS